MKIKTDVIIIGAGPTGLSLACQLTRYDVDFIIVDIKESITVHSKALAVHARTLEIYDQLGIADDAISEGTIGGRANIISGGAVRATLDLSELGKNLSPFPFALVLEQSKNERLLLDYLQKNGQSVLWQIALETVSQIDEKVTATVKNADGKLLGISAKYLVGCDGAKSTVRRQLNFTFEGHTIDSLFYVADVEMEFTEPRDGLYVAFGTDSFAVFFPMKGENRWRIVGNLPDTETRAESEIDYDEIEARIKQTFEMPLDITSVNWFSIYRVHSRRVDKFSDGRVFLAGDAAHIHTPAGGQGMNTGIGDTYNLAWKLAFVLHGKADESLLDTYNTERLETAKRLLETTDRLFELGTHDNFFTAFIRTYVFPFVAEYALRLDLVKQSIFPLVSQIGIDYRHSQLSRHADDAEFKVKAGDRMPYFTIDGKSVFDYLRGPRFHFLVFSNEEINSGEYLGESKQAGRWIDYQPLPLAPRVAEIFGVSKPFSLLLRPDNYISFISERVSSDELKSYPFCMAFSEQIQFLIDDLTDLEYLT